MAVFHFKFHSLEEYKNVDISKMTKEEFEIYSFRGLAYHYSDAEDAVVVSSDEETARNLLNEKEDTTQYSDKEVWVCEELDSSDNRVVNIWHLEF